MRGKKPDLQTLPFLQHWFLSFLPGSPRVILPSWPSPYLSSLQPALRVTQTQTHTFVSCWDISFFVSRFYPAVFAVGTAQFTSQFKPTHSSRAASSPVLLKPEGFMIHWVSVVRSILWIQAGQPWILLWKRTNSLWNTSLFVMVQDPPS